MGARSSGGTGVSSETLRRGTGDYIWEDHFFPEVVDKDTGEPLPEGRMEYRFHHLAKYAVDALTGPTTSRISV